MVVPLIVPAPGDLRAILINNNAEKTKSPVVDLILSASGATHMMLSNVPTFLGASWETFVTAKSWTLADTQVGPGHGDGPKTVYVKFKNSTETSGVFDAVIILDTAPPVVGAVPILINGGHLDTDSRSVTLSLNATGATWMELFNENELGNPQGTILSYSEEVGWSLSELNGRKTVYVVFADDIDNRTSFFSATIFLIGQEARTPVITAPADGSITPDHFVTVSGTSDPGATVRLTIK